MRSSHALLREFCRLTGVPMVLNTSLNGPGEPIVETPMDALWFLLGLGLDILSSRTGSSSRSRRAWTSWS